MYVHEVDGNFLKFSHVVNGSPPHPTHTTHLCSSKLDKENQTMKADNSQPAVMYDA